jgi:activating signal cointegrator 1
MKAITLHEPWAWLVLHGWKEVETRSWSTDYRGLLAIHAGKKRDVDGAMLHLRMNSIRGVSDRLIPPFEELPFGAVIATCRLSAVIPMHRLADEAKRLAFEPARGWEVEQLFGNYERGRFAWLLRDVTPVDPPIETHGWQRLWNWTPPAHLSGNLGLNP